MIVVGDFERMSRNIRFLRNRRRMSRAKFAQYIGVSYAQLYCIERKITNHIYYDALMTLSEIYGIPAEEILSEDLETKYADTKFHYSR